LHRVAGYGKKLLDDETVRTKQKELQKKIAALRNRLQPPFAQLSALDQQLHTWIENERQLRVQSRVVNGQRQMNPRQAQKLDECRRAIAAMEREKRKIRQPYQKLFNRLKRHEQEWLRLQGKEKIYKVDVELDQILTYFRVAFVNLCTYFQMKFLGNLSITKNATKRMTLATLLHRIFLLPATVEQTAEWRRVYLKRNHKDKAMMAILDQVIPKLNALNLRYANGRQLEFFLK
jgi:hypothetical protein